MVKKIFWGSVFLIGIGALIFLYLNYQRISQPIEKSFLFIPNTQLTKSNLYPIDSLKIVSSSSESAKLTWHFADRITTVSEGVAKEYSALSGFRIYRDGYWYTDVDKNARDFVDKDLLASTKYSYAVAPLTFDNKIEGEMSQIAEYTTGNWLVVKPDYAPPHIKSLLVEGDSIAAGQRAAANRGWADQVAQNLLDEEESYTNDAVSGSLSADVLSRLKNNDRLANYDALAIGVGLNDLYGSSQEIGNVSLSEYKRNINKIVDHVQLNDQKMIVLVGIPYYRDCCASGKSFIKVESWNKGLAEIAAHRGVLYVDTYALMRQNGADNLMDDVLHPNQEGHNIIAQEMLRTINQQLQK